MKSVRHCLDSVDVKRRRAVCSVCGPTHVYSRGYSKNGIQQWRCGIKWDEVTKEKAVTEKGRESSRRRTKRYQENNREKCNSAVRKWKGKNKKRVREQRRDWYERNYSRELQHNANRRARELDAYVEDVDRKAVYLRDEGLCGICGRTVQKRSFEIDHIVPLSRGGKHSMKNVQLSHASCNRRKHSKITLPT